MSVGELPGGKRLPGCIGFSARNELLRRYCAAKSVTKGPAAGESFMVSAGIRTSRPCSAGKADADPSRSIADTTIDMRAEFFTTYLTVPDRCNS